MRYEIKNTNGYYLADMDGNIYSRPRKRTKGGLIKATLHKKTGYLRVCFCLSGKKVSKSVHRLIAETFIINPDNLPEVNHKDGDKTNNKVNNLEWSTKSNNQKHKHDVIGVIIHNRKLTKENVFEILSNPKIPRADIAAKFGVTVSCIESVKSGRNYKNYLTQFAELNKPIT